MRSIRVVHLLPLSKLIVIDPLVGHQGNALPQTDGPYQRQLIEHLNALSKPT